MKVAAILVGIMLCASPALAQVGIAPRESKAGATETYTLRVPSEGGKTTTSVVLEVPDGVTIASVSELAGASHLEARTEGRIAQITWAIEIKPGATAQPVFVAKNPAKGDAIVWKVRQKYSDGTLSEWIGEAGSRAPAPATKLLPTSMDQNQPIVEFFTRYDAAFVAKDLDRLATMYHPDVTIFEGGGINNGWVDYRDNHIGPELKSFNGLKFSHSNIRVQMLGADAAYVTSDYAIETVGANGPTRSGGLETDVLVRQNGTWVIRHTHTSARRQRPGGGVGEELR